jgi:prepilin-type N-terminal cleavage/methylation domain-containing protein
MRRQPHAGRDHGFTLTELLIAIVLLGLVGAAITAVVTTSLHQQTQVQDRGEALTAARNALQRASRDIRRADPLLTPTPATQQNTNLTLALTPSGAALSLCYGTGSSTTPDCQGTLPISSTTCPDGTTARSVAHPCPGSVAVTYRLVSGTLYQDVAASSGTTKTTALVRNVVNTGTQPVFTYLPASSAAAGTTCANGDGTYNRSCISRVAVTLWVQPAGATRPVQVTDQDVELRNGP